MKIFSFPVFLVLCVLYKVRIIGYKCSEQSGSFNGLCKSTTYIHFKINLIFPTKVIFRASCLSPLTNYFHGKPYPWKRRRKTTLKSFSFSNIFHFLDAGQTTFTNSINPLGPICSSRARERR